jgi:hypothetical protein
MRRFGIYGERMLVMHPRRDKTGTVGTRDGADVSSHSLMCVISVNGCYSIFSTWEEVGYRQSVGGGEGEFSTLP